MDKPGIKTVFAKFLVRLGISANFLTAAGLFLALASAWSVYRENFFMAGVALLFSGLFDLLDGAVARASGSQSKFGGILDSTLDRYGDGAVLGAAALYYCQRGAALVSVLAIAALVGSFGISYVRARAECEVEDCRVGFWERGERLVLIALSLLVNNLSAAVALLAVGTQWTVFQRLAFADLQTKNRAPGNIPFYLRTSPRNSRPYYLKVCLAVLALFFVRA